MNLEQIKSKAFNNYPDTFVVTADLDILRDEGLSLFEKQESTDA